MVSIGFFFEILGFMLVVEVLVTVLLLKILPHLGTIANSMYKSLSIKVADSQQQTHLLLDSLPQDETIDKLNMSRVEYNRKMEAQQNNLGEKEFNSDIQNPS